MGPPPAPNLREKTPHPTSKISEQAPGSGYDRRACCEALGNLAPPPAAPRRKGTLGYSSKPSAFALVSKRRRKRAPPLWRRSTSPYQKPVSFPSRFSAWAIPIVKHDALEVAVSFVPLSGAFVECLLVSVRALVLCGGGRVGCSRSGS